MSTIRCFWCGEDPLYVKYHDTEWGVPTRDSRELWEKLVLEGFQSGLSWITILRKRQAFRRAFAGFDPVVIASWTGNDVDRLMSDSGIIRHRGKIESVITNARAFLEVEETTGFADLVWEVVDGRPVQNIPASMDEVPARTPASERLSRRLRERGFKFVGPVTAYAFMQSKGLVNDHLACCHRAEPIRQMGFAFG